MSLAILFHFLCAQHDSNINIPIIRCLRLFCWITTLVVLFLVRCVLEFRCGWVGVVSVLQAEARNTDIRQFLRRVWPIQLAFLRFIPIGCSFPSWIYVILLHFFTRSVQWSSQSHSSIAFQTFKAFFIYFPKYAWLTTIQGYVPNVEFHKFLP